MDLQQLGGKKRKTTKKPKAVKSSKSSKSSKPSKSSKMTNSKGSKGSKGSKNSKTVKGGKTMSPAVKANGAQMKAIWAHLNELGIKPTPSKVMVYLSQLRAMAKKEVKDEKDFSAITKHIMTEVKSLTKEKLLKEIESAKKLK